MDGRKKNTVGMTKNFGMMTLISMTLITDCTQLWASGSARTTVIQHNV